MESYIPKADKNLGQNFLLDPAICAKIASVANNIKDKTVIEVGPGPAKLTKAILDLNPKKLIVIEKDARFLPFLESLAQDHSNLEIILADATKVDLLSLQRTQDEKIKIIANLPYNIGTRLLIDWLDHAKIIDELILMLQKEVVTRICANSCNYEYGRLAVLVQCIANAKKIFDVKPGSFVPAPKVHSSIVHITPKNDDALPSTQLYKAIKHVTHVAFTQRRKMLKSSLKSLPNIEQIFKNLSINSNLRAENLTVQDYINLANFTKEFL